MAKWLEAEPHYFVHYRIYISANNGKTSGMGITENGSAVEESESEL